MATNGEPPTTEPPQCPCGGDHSLSLTDEQAETVARVLFTVRQRMAREETDRAAS